MDETLEAITQILERGAGPAALAVLFASALLEYVFPPFPGDTVTLLGAFMVARYGWSPSPVFLALLAGNGAGAMVAFYAGVWLRARERLWEGRRARLRAPIERVIASFARHGEPYIALNRFVPALRALFFVAAGMAGLRPGRVLAFALLSAALWNLLIFAAGFAIGTSFERLRAAFHAYALVAWIALGLAALALVVRAVRDRRRPS
ncbi:MAG: VTT domain-containing protein [Myxococcota bacterium]|mgnify:CR=1 FL=1